MRFLLFWFLLSVVAALVAWSKGRSPGLFFSISLVFSPLVGLLGAWLIPARTVSTMTRSAVYRDCPKCGAPAGLKTARCSRCSTALPPVIDADPS